MKITKAAVLFFVISISLLFSSIFSAPPARGESALFSEDFRTLDEWKPVLFPKIRKHTLYSVQSDKDRSFLRAESAGSASGLVWKKTFNVYEYPKARWSWKVNNIYRSPVNPSLKSSDDYPIRIYLLFEYQPNNSPLFEKIAYGVAKRLYGEYPPHSALNYVWSSTDWGKNVLISPYTSKVRLIALRKGPQGIGLWHQEEVDIVDDYRRAFGVDPPPIATIGIMNDSDDTKEQSTSYVGFVEVYR